MTKGYKRGDAAKDTGSSTKSVSRAWHTARDDATSSGYFKRGSGNTDKWKDTSSSAHKSAGSLFKSIMGKS